MLKGDRKMFEIAVEAFKWESDAQREGFLALVKFWHDHGLQPVLPLTSMDNLTALFFIQKDHDSNEYWRELWADQVSKLQDEIKIQMDEVSQLKTQVEHMRETIRAQNMALENITLKLKS
jgi:hypothetical protein